MCVCVDTVFVYLIGEALKGTEEAKNINGNCDGEELISHKIGLQYGGEACC